MQQVSKEIFASTTTIFDAVSPDLDAGLAIDSWFQLELLSLYISHLESIFNTELRIARECKNFLRDLLQIWPLPHSDLKPS